VRARHSSWFERVDGKRLILRGCRKEQRNDNKMCDGWIVQSERSDIERCDDTECIEDRFVLGQNVRRAADNGCGGNEALKNGRQVLQGVSQGQKHTSSHAHALLG
jgi:hypothetical protein